ncbi:hypothetical protein DUD99_10325 [Salmonella enterica subsp. enterica]|uniref:Uncharacterized protein n=1 Tax=Salmonella enterica subsp. enterica serovar Denver TaxID=1954177 RepID=A0A657FWY0_SALET|nr:hypothetical protein [Salmonella enterica]EAC2143116.1 hypothetical protein [Salmonella enterica subsp. enterica]ECS6017015.1 hypothetical protein [Salmonella enterica subsp. enterica serovar Rough O:k:1,5]ECS7544211.1 hypothetical protein [Salmonella enterica subsp. enterica serovar Denver]OXM29810.1 hypothetical protein NW10_15630 [Salmonella enterica subsp. enterica serovar Weslaco]
MLFQGLLTRKGIGNSVATSASHTKQKSRYTSRTGSVSAFVNRSAVAAEPLSPVPGIHDDLTPSDLPCAAILLLEG